MTDVEVRAGVGPMLRDWRQRRRLSQMALALDAGVSARHLSFVETGRSQPSREMVLHLAEELDVPLRERNHMLLAAGYAPVFGERDLEDPEMRPVRDALEQILAAHEPFPSLIVDRHWGLVSANAAAMTLMGDIAPHLLEPPVNVFRASFHPEGLAPRIVNLAEWREHALERLRRQLAATGDPAVETLIDEISAYPGPDPDVPVPDRGLAGELVVPFRLRGPDGSVLSFFSTVATFGTAVDVTLAELSIESFFPADAATAEAVRAAA